MEKEKEEVNARLLDEDDFEYSLDCYPNIIVLCPIAIDLCIMG